MVLRRYKYQPKQLRTTRAYCFNSFFKYQNEKCKELSEKTFALLSDLKRAPSENLIPLLNRCWPLNPLTAISLGPISKRSYGQNQRSIFNFLASGEPLALKDFLARTSLEDEGLYSLSDLWDYLDVNWEAQLP